MKQIMGMKTAQYRIPEEVVELYAWRNGQSSCLPFFNGLRFQPFEDAVEYANIVEKYSDGEFPLMIFQEPNYDAGYRFKCGASERQQAPAYRWLHGDEQIETTSLSELLSAVAEAFESDVFRPNEHGELDTNDEGWNAVVVRHHPDRVRGVNALLDRRFTELNGEELRDAFYDLWRMHNQETAALVRQCLEGGRHWDSRDFDTFQAVLGTGIGVQDEWSRDFALGLAMSSDSRLRREALMLLAWRWRGNLPLSSKHIEGLINQIISSPVSDFDNRERAMLLERSGDRSAIPALLRLLDAPDAANEARGCGMRDTRIAALRALGRLQAVEARQVCLTVAEDASVEAAAKQWIRETLRISGNLDGHGEPPMLRRWIEQVKHSSAS
jgi:hypothetical protein